MNVRIDYVWVIRVLDKTYLSDEQVVASRVDGRVIHSSELVAAID